MSKFGSMGTPSPAIAVIGCGNFARRQHLPNLAGWEGVRLAVVCDPDREAAEACVSAFGAERAETAAAAVFDDPGIDAVVITVPDALQADLTVRALEAGKDVYVEKPAAVNAGEFAAVVAARRRSGRRVAVGLNKRFAPAFQATKRHLDAMGGVRALFLRMADDAWRWAAALPPGSLLRHDVCHHFDLACWLTGSPVEAVAAAGSRPDDNAVLLRHANGVASVVMFSGHATMEFPKERVEAITERGSVTMDDFVEVCAFGGPDGFIRETFPGFAACPADRPWVERLGDRGLAGMQEVRAELGRKGRVEGEPGTLPNFIRDQGWRTAIRSFFSSGNNEDLPSHASLEDASHASAVVDAVLQARESGNWVRVEPNEGLSRSGRSTPQSR